MAMDKVTDDLYVGDIKDAESRKRLEDNNIETILNLSTQSSSPEFRREHDKLYAHIPMRDGDQSDERIRFIIDTASRLREMTNESMLVHCDVGSSRSVVIAASLMSLDNAETLYTNIDRIRTVRAAANPVKILTEKVARITHEVYNS
jgi:predicted protein tyrosine phosphatase